MSFTVDSIDHVEVFVQDIEAGIRWYSDVLGLKEVARWDPHPVLIGAGGTKLALFKAKAEPSRDEHQSIGEGPNWHLVAWRTTEEGFEAAQRHLAKCGVTFSGPIDHGSARSIYFSDPDGHRLEITYYL